MQLGRLWELSRDAFEAWLDDYAPSMGAALAYYTLFAIAPLLLIIIALAGVFFGQDAARGEIVSELAGLLGHEGATAIEGLLKSASDPKTSTIATIISGVTLLVAATTVFAELQSDLDRIWKVPAKDKPTGIWGLIRARFLSFGLIIGIGFLMIVSLALSAALAAFGHWYGAYLSGWATLLQLTNFVLSFAVITAAFAMIYKLMPNVTILWRDVWVGSAVTALLFTVGKYLIGLYIGKAGVASGFGAAGSLIVVLVWVYYSTQIFLLGAEFTHVFAERDGSMRNELKRATPENPTRGQPSVAAGSPEARGSVRRLEPASAFDETRVRGGVEVPRPPVGATLTPVLDFERASRAAYRRHRMPPPIGAIALRTAGALAGGWVAGRLLRPQIERAAGRSLHAIERRISSLLR